MKFMLLYKIHQEKRHDVTKAFSNMSPEDDKNDMGGEINLIGRWHDMVQSKGVAIFESNSAEAVMNWALNWNGFLDLEISLVLDDAETRAFGKKKFA